MAKVIELYDGPTDYSEIIPGMPKGWIPPFQPQKEFAGTPYAFADAPTPEVAAGDSIVTKLNETITPVTLPNQIPAEAYPAAFNPETQYNSPSELAGGVALVGNISGLTQPTVATDGGVFQPVVWIAIIIAGLYLLSRMKGK